MWKISSVVEGGVSQCQSQHPLNLICSLISKFIISTATHQHVRVASVRLEGPPELSNLTITSCPMRQGVMARGIPLQRLQS